MRSFNNTNHIRGLDGLRFIGTFIILFYHIEHGKVLFKIPSIEKYLQIGIGNSTMTLFFVLSGFLIFYLLLNEKKQSGAISVKSFYKKRIARIWPVYYILVFSSIFFFVNNKWFYIPEVIKQNDDYYGLVWIYLLHMPNFNIFFSSALVAVGHLWSLGVEEQFYAFAPWIIKKTKSFVKVFVLIIIIKVILKLGLAFSYRVLTLPIETVQLLKSIEHFLFKLRFEAFALGGIAAYVIVENKERVLKFVYLLNVQRINIILLIFTISLGMISESIQVLYTFNFAIIILNIVGNTKSVFVLDYKLTNYIGSISYGIYMYQIPIIFLLLNVLKPYYSSENALEWNFIYYITSILLPIIISAISYELIEKKIIRWSHH
ncbi:MAG: acyltransferase [Bacteroidia bacterium]|nr:acyltransferase [Bacteroidia bacterium]